MDLGALTDPTPPVGPLFSLLVVLGVGTGVIGGLCVYAWLMRARHLRGAAAEVEADAGGPLRPGPATVAGEVVGGGGGAPVVVRIHERGLDYSIKNSRQHDWIEERREVIVRPFRMALPSGETIRVEPDERLLLAHPLDGLEGGLGHRARVSVLRAGTRVRVTGTLVPDPDPHHRHKGQAAPALLLRPPPRGRMVIASESLADHHRDRARRYRKVGLLTLVLLLLSHGLLFSRYEALAIFGHIVEKPIETRSTHVRLQPPNGSSSPRHDEVVETKRVDNVRFLIAGPFEKRGGSASLGILTVVAYLFFVMTFLLFGTLPHAIGRRWWEVRRLVEGGRGPLRSDSITYR
jgi:hypothetical protein